MYEYYQRILKMTYLFFDLNDALSNKKFDVG